MVSASHRSERKQIASELQSARFHTAACQSAFDGFPTEFQISPPESLQRIRVIVSWFLPYLSDVQVPHGTARRRVGRVPAGGGRAARALVRHARSRQIYHDDSRVVERGSDCAGNIRKALRYSYRS